MIFCIGDSLLREMGKTDDLKVYSYLSSQCMKIIESDYNILSVESKEALSLVPKILKKKEIPPNLSRVLNYCFKNYFQQFGLNSQVSKKIIITNEMCSKIKDCIYININCIEKHELSLGERVTLLSEDVSDCEFYIALANCLYYKRVLTNRCQIKLRISPGAGAIIGANLAASVEVNKDIVLAICDSDKFHPLADYGDTAKALLNSYLNLSSKGYVHLDYKILDVAEKENLIRPSEYNKFLPGHIVPNLDTYLELEKNDEEFKFLKFIDFKGGVKKKYILENKSFYDELYGVCSDFLNLSILDQVKENQSISKALGRKCLNDFDPDYLDTENTNWIDNYRKNIALEVFSWGISLRQQFIG